MKAKVRLILAASAAALLAACGGGGGGGGGEPVAKTFDLQAAYVNYLTTSASKNFTLSGTVNGAAVTGSGTVTLGLLQAATFENAPAQVKTQTISGTLNISGQAVPYGVATQSFFDASYKPLGSLNGGYSVVEAAAPLPTAARINDSGTWMTLKNYSSSAKVTLQGSSTVTYALAADGVESALLTLTMTESNSGGSILSTETSRYRVTTTSQIEPLSEQYLEPGSSLTLNYQ